MALDLCDPKYQYKDFRYIITGMMGVGKTYILDQLPKELVYQDYTEDKIITNNSIGYLEPGLTDILTRLLVNQPNGTFSDNCLGTHLIYDGFYFTGKNLNTFASMFTELNQRLGKLSHIDMLEKYKYKILILKKPWLEIKHNILTRGRPYEVEAINTGEINESTYDMFYNSLPDIYRELKFENVEIVNLRNDTDVLATILQKTKGE